jgi:DNA polymerase-3 subunit delta'
VRELSDFLALSPHRRGRKVVLLVPAEELNISAANALLKTLEEPPRETIFLIVANQPQRILPTVRSRCRLLPMSAPPVAQSLVWLAEQGVEEPLLALSEAGSAPLRALENSRGNNRRQRQEFLARLAQDALDPIAYAANLDLIDFARVVGWLYKWTYDLVANRMAGRTRYNLDFAVPLGRISARADVARIGQLHRTLVRYQSTLGHPLNARLALENLFLSYLSCVPRTPI